MADEQPGIIDIIEGLGGVQLVEEDQLVPTLSAEVTECLDAANGWILDQPGPTLLNKASFQSVLNHIAYQCGREHMCPNRVDKIVNELRGEDHIRFTCGTCVFNGTQDDLNSHLGHPKKNRRGSSSCSAYKDHRLGGGWNQSQRNVLREMFRIDPNLNDKDAFEAVKAAYISKEYDPRADPRSCESAYVEYLAVRSVQICF